MQLSLPRRTRAVLAVVGAASVLALSTGCGAVSDLLGGADDAQRDEPGGQITEASDADVFSLQVGDCVNVANLTSEEVDSVPVVPCADPHDAEIYAEIELPEGDYPTDLDEQADAFCGPEYEKFMGISDAKSAYYWWPLTPTAAGWSQADDRIVQCVVDTRGEMVTGTLKGSAK